MRTLGPGRLGEMLVIRGLATDQQIADALAEQQRTGSRLGNILVSSAIVDERHLIAILAEQFQLPLVDLTDYQPDLAVLALVPEQLSRDLPCLPFAVEGSTLYVAVADVLDDQTMMALRRSTHLEPARVPGHAQLDSRGASALVRGPRRRGRQSRAAARPQRVGGPRGVLQTASDLHRVGAAVRDLRGHSGVPTLIASSPRPVARAG